MESRPDTTDAPAGGAALAAAPDAGEAARATVSVVIPTRNRPRALQRCLRALVRDPDLELIVVDDGSEPPLAGQLSGFGGIERVKVIRGRGRGPAAARNAGLEAAGGDYVCFTDDDCIPAKWWASSLAEAARTSPGGVSCGRTVPPRDASAPMRASQVIVNHLQLHGISESGALRFAPACNLACSRAALAENRFDDSYALAGGEDREMSDRLIAAGRAPVYARHAVVIHHQREGLRSLLRRHYRYGRGGARYRRAGGRGPSPRFYRELIARARAQGAAVLALVVAAQVATLAGILRERLASG